MNFQTINRSPIPGLETALTEEDLKLACTKCNELYQSNDHNYQDTKEHIDPLLQLLKEYEVEEVFRIVDVHEHFDLPCGSHMVAKLVATEAKRTCMSIEPARDQTFEPHKLCGYKFTLIPEKGLRPYEFRLGPLLDTNEKYSDAISRVSNYLDEHKITSLGLEYTMPEVLRKPMYESVSNVNCTSKRRSVAPPPGFASTGEQKRISPPPGFGNEEPEGTPDVTTHHEAGRVSAALGPEVMASPAASSSTSDHQPPFTSNSSQQASSQTSTEVSTSPSTTILRTNKGRSLKNYLPNRSNAKSLPSLAASLPLSFAPATSASTSPFPPLVATGQQSPFYSAHLPHLVSGSHPGLLVPLSSIGLPVPAEGGYMVSMSPGGPPTAYPRFDLAGSHGQ